MASPKKAKPAGPPPARLAICADVHIGNRQAYAGEYGAGLNARGRLSLEVLRRAVTAAKAEGATHLVVAGDLFNERRPEPAVIAAVQRVLDQELPVIVIPGNHDMNDASPLSPSTACEPVAHTCTLVRGPQRFDLPDLSLLAVPFTAEEPVADYVERCLRDLSSPVDVLVAHVGVWSEDSPHWCRSARDGMHYRRLLDALGGAGVKTAFVGNYHHHREWADSASLAVIQVGALCPGGFGDGGLFPAVGGLALADRKSYRLVEVPGPRFLKLGAGEEIPEPGPNTLYVRATGDVTGIDRAEDVEIVPEEVQVEAVAAPGVEDGASALTEYAAARDLAPAVLETARHYWARAS